MRTVEEVRRLRLALLVSEFGSYAALNEKLDRLRTDSTLSQYANQSAGSKSKVKKSKAMGSDAARRLEAVCNKEPGWMDTDPDLWPFADIDHQKIMALQERHKTLLEGAMMGMAIQLGLEIRKGIPA